MNRATRRQLRIWVLAALGASGGLVLAGDPGAATGEPGEPHGEVRSMSQADDPRLSGESRTRERRRPEGAPERRELHREREGRESGYGQGYEARQQSRSEENAARVGGAIDGGR